MQGMAHDGQDGSGIMKPEYPYSRDTLRPGRVVWAKVEGHDWWPAKIVRRRAVPREVRGGGREKHLRRMQHNASACRL